MEEVLLDLKCVPAEVQIDGVAKDGTFERVSLRTRGHPVLIVRADPLDGISDHVDEPHVREVGGDPLRDSRPVRIRGVSGARFPYRDRSGPGAPKLLRVPADPAAPPVLLLEEVEL